MTISRRRFLELAGYGAGASALTFGSFSPALAVPGTNQVLVMIFLRGGADSSFMVAPKLAALMADDGVGNFDPGDQLDFYMDEDLDINTVNSLGRAPLFDWTNSNNEPLFKAPSGTRRLGGSFLGGQGETLKVEAGTDDWEHYWMNPGMPEMAQLFNDGEMSIVLGVGGTNNRSHFQSMDAMERARPYNTDHGTQNGWMWDYLDAIGTGTTPTGVSMSSGLAESMRGAGAAYAAAIPSIDSFAINFGDATQAEYDTANLGITRDHYESFLNEMYLNPNDSMGCVTGANHPTWKSSRDSGASAQLALQNYSVASSISSPAGDNWRGTLKDAYRLITSRGDAPEAPVNVINVDIGGWDSHDLELEEISANIQGTPGGTGIKGLDNEIYNFVQALKNSNNDFDNTTIMVMSEFGRTLDFNGNYGTDHGDGGLMFMLSGSSNFKGGRIINSGETGAHVPTGATGNSSRKLHWPTHDDPKEWKDPGNGRWYVPAITDFRSVFAEALEKSMGLSGGSSGPLYDIFNAGSNNAPTVSQLQNGFYVRKSDQKVFASIPGGGDPDDYEQRSGYPGLFT